MQADLVLEGGGVKGIGLVGAVAALTEAGFTFERVAGTSSGAIVGSLVAAGAGHDELEQLLTSVDYASFTDKGLLDRFGLLGIGASLLFEKGIFEGDALRSWLREQLARFGVETFADLRRHDEESALPPERRYRLVVLVSDLSRGRLVRLPWEYADYGLDPDTQLVADAVFASAAIPLFFEPVVRDTAEGPSYLVDGGLLSNFPVEVFDRADDRRPRWPTIGVKLSARPDPDEQIRYEIDGFVSYLQALVGTTLTAQDRRFLQDPCAVRRTVFVDTTGVNPIDFGLPLEVRRRLYRNGRRAARRWLRTWDFDDFLRDCWQG